MSIPADPLESLSPLLDALAERIVDKWLASTATRMVAQAGSPLGPRRHREAVKRRMRNGEGGATIVDKRHYLTHQALQEELGLIPKPPTPDPEPAPVGGPPSSPDAAAHARDLLVRLQSLRAPKKGGH